VIKEPQKKIEFQPIHCLGKTTKTGPRLILARFLRCTDRDKGMHLARSKLTGKDFTVDEDIPKDLYDLRKAQMNKVKTAKKNNRYVVDRKHKVILSQGISDVLAVCGLRSNKAAIEVPCPIKNGRVAK